MASSGSELSTVDALRCLGRNLKDLRHGIPKLVREREVVQDSIRVCRLRKLVVEEKVESWLTHTAAFVAQMDVLMQNNFFRRNLWSINRVARRVAKDRVKLAQLIEDGNFAKVAYSFPLLPRVPETSVSADGTVGLTSTFETIWYSLTKEEDVNLIFIQGLHGVGKTTILRKIHFAIGERSENFENIINISRNGVHSYSSYMELIRGDILRQLNLPFSSTTTEIEKIQLINNALGSRRCILLLDNFQFNFVPQDFGLPRSGFKSKIVVAFCTKSRPTDWNSVRVIEMQPLLAEEAWVLLKMQLPIQVFSHEEKTYDLARRAANRCGGLPLAVLALGRAMRDSTSAQQWKDALRFITRHEDETYSHILRLIDQNYFYPFSDRLTSAALTRYEMLLHFQIEDEKMIIGLCSMFPAESLIEKNQLIEYWIGGKPAYTYTKKQRRIGYDILERLESECLIEGRGEFVIMHQFIYRFATWVASGYGKLAQRICVQAGDHLTEVPNSIKWEVVEKVSMMENRIQKLDDKVGKCPNLKTLILSKNKLYFISEHFFHSMPLLSVLDLSWSEIEELPKAISKLIFLKSLNLSHSHIFCLPESIKELENLQNFNLSYIGELSVFPSGVISHLVSLQSLNLFCSGYETWMGNDVDTNQKSEEGGDISPKRETSVDTTQKEEVNCRIDSLSFLSELEHSRSLVDLGLNVTGGNTLEELKNLKKTGGCITSLSFIKSKGIKSLPLSSIDFNGLETLEISKCSDLKAFDIDITSNLGIHRVKIDDCWLLEEISGVCLMPQLQSLKVERCMNLKEIVTDSVIRGRCWKPFVSVRSLYLGYLFELTVISESVLSFESLEELTVVFCPKLKKLPFDQKSALNTLKAIKGHKKWWDQLTWVDTQTRQAFHPYFVDIDS